MSEPLVDRSRLDNLLETMLRVPGLTDSDVRDVDVDQLVGLLRRPFDPARFANAHHDLLSLINSCLACSGGLRLFAQLLLRNHPSEASAQVVTITEEVVGSTLLSVSDRDLLCRHLTGIAIGQIADAVGDLVDPGDLTSLQTWRDVSAAIRMLEALALPDDGVPQLLMFTQRLAQIVGGERATDLREWIEMVAGGLGVAGLAAPDQTAGERAWPSTDDSAPDHAGDEGQPRAVPRAPAAGIIWGGVPIRNHNFSGRQEMLERLGQALRTSSKASVFPQALHGLGGVGKTQLVLEYVYLHSNEYDLVWWIAAEQASSVLAALSRLAERLGLPINENRQQTARMVLDRLADTDLSWLLVYDNADEDTTSELIPSVGGHVIITTRNKEWATKGPAIEVDVFQRAESIELLQRRSMDNQGNVRIQTADADALAHKLGDLPLALEQAVAWFLATAMPIPEYVDLLDSHIKDLLSEGKPQNYPLTVAAFVGLALEKLRDGSPAAAQLFELFAFLGGEPVAFSLLRRGKDARLPEPLRTTLGLSINMNRIVRDLNRHGLAKVDPLRRVQVHRLVQLVLRESLTDQHREQTLRNAQRLLAKANSGDPDEIPEEMREDVGPHIERADLIHAPDLEARQVVLDHARYLYITGDYENSLNLARRAADAWQTERSDPRLGPDGELTLIARAQIANASRALGDSATAARLARDTYDRLSRNPMIGPTHETTLITGNQVGADLRIEGRYREALEFDRMSVESHRDVFELDSNYTLRAQANLAVDYRMVGDFPAAFRLDQEIAGRWEDVGASDPRAMAEHMNLARSCYGLGAYQFGLNVVERWLPALQLRMGTGNSQVLLAGRTHAILLRKLGRLDEAVTIIRDNEERTTKRFGPNHEFAVAATCSYANVMRDLGELDRAHELIREALERYRCHFGERHPLTLVALVNEAVICRALGQLAEARSIDQRCYTELADVLAPDHPYAICAGVSLATDHALAGEHEAAADLSARMLEVSRAISGGPHEARNGGEHPYLLMRAVNLSQDLRAIGRMEEADALYAESMAGLRVVLGGDHPDVLAIAQGARTEGDIEPPPT